MKSVLKAGFIVAGLFVGIALGRDLGAVAVAKINSGSASTVNNQ